MRYAFGEAMADLVEKDRRVYVLACDIGYGVFDRLIKEHPRHFINTGIQEAATIGMAAGMAMEGLKPWVYTITPFLLERPFEQIKLDIVQQKQDVKLAGYWDYHLLGPTHVTQDVEGLCKILGIRLFKPSSAEDARRIILKAHESNKPAFISLTKDKTKNTTPANTKAY